MPTYKGERPKKDPVDWIGKNITTKLQKATSIKFLFFVSLK